MFAHLLLLTVVLLGIYLVRSMRTHDGVGRLYLVWIALLLAGAAVAVFEDDRFLGALAVGLTTVSVVVPWMLEAAIRTCFRTQRLALAVRLSRWRALLMPGSMLGHRLVLLEGLSILEQRGVDAALSHFRTLAAETDDEESLRDIDEQIVSMLFYAERWDDAIRHYERRFRPGYAAFRPGLALGLMRAYGETTRLDRAARLMRDLEEGPFARDPRTAEVLGQARLTFLAYAGATGTLAWITDHDRYEELGLSEAAAAFYRGVALGRAGEVQQAESTLRKVDALAGPRDARLRESAQRRIEALGEGAVELEPELRSYAQGVAQRLMGLLRAAPGWRLHGRRTWVTYALIIAMAAVYGVILQLDAGGEGLVRLGAMTRELWAAGAWERALTSVWLHHDLLALLASAYALWLSGQLVERVFGPARMFILAFAPPVVATMAAATFTPALIVPSAASLLTLSVLTGALWTLLPSRTPGLAARARRNLVVTLSALVLITLLMILPAALGSPTSPVAVLVTIVVSGTVVLTGRASNSPDRAAGLVAGLLIVAQGVAWWQLNTREVEQNELESATACTAGRVAFAATTRFEPVPADPQELYGLPIYEGLVDRLELDARSAGGVVQVFVADPPAEAGDLALFGRDPALARRVGVTDVSPRPEELDFADRVVELRINGRVTARVVEHALRDDGGDVAAVLVLAAAPAEALDHSLPLYASLLESARLRPADEASGLSVRCVDAPAGSDETSEEASAQASEVEAD